MDDLRSDEALMLAWGEGDGAAFALLYARWRARLYRYLAHQAPREADELFQDVWLRVTHARSGYRPAAKFSTWLFRIAHNRLMDHFRAHARHLAIEYDDERLAQLPADGGANPAAWVVRKETAAALVAAVAALPAPQREAFLLAEEGELDVPDIAAATGVARETAKSRLRYAHAKLRAALEDWR